MLPQGQFVFEQAGAVIGSDAGSTATARTNDPVFALDAIGSREIVTLLDRDIAVIKAATRGPEQERAAQIHFTRRAHVVVWDSILVTSVDDDYRLDLRDSNGKVIATIHVDRPRRDV